MKFHITITDNETNAIIHDLDSDAILASIDDVDSTTGVVVLTKCNLLTFSATISGLISLLDRLETEEPLACRLAKNALRKNSSKATEGNTEENTEE